MQLANLHASLTESQHNLQEYRKQHDSPASSEAGATLQSQLLAKLKRIETKLKALQIAKSYAKALLVSSELCAQARELVSTDPEAAIAPYVQMVKFSQYIADQAGEQACYEEVKLHLMSSRKQLWEDLNAMLKKNFEATLEGLSWPTPIKPPYGPQMKAKLDKFEQAFFNLLLLQTSSSDHEELTGDNLLAPVSIMMEAISLRFRFHFEGSKPTNRLDKPEWYLTHVKNTIAAHIPFLMTVVQPIVDRASDHLQIRISVKDHFIRAILVNVARKLRNDIPRLLDHPSYLSHTVHEILTFDQLLQDDFAYVTLEKNVQRETASAVILQNREWFDAWFQAEKTFARTRYDDILLDAHAFELDENEDIISSYKQQASDPRSVKATKSVAKLINLLESITDAYKLLPSLEQRLRFFADIQLGLLDGYKYRISSAIDSLEAVSLIRSVPVPGGLPDAVTGVIMSSEQGGVVAVLHRIYRWWTSACSVSEVLRVWADDELFLDLQFEVNQNPELFQEMANQYESPDSLFVPRLEKLFETANDSVFAAPLASFQRLCERTEKLMVKVIVREWNTATRDYSKRNPLWQPSGDAVPTEISSELYKPLQDLRLTCGYLHQTLPNTAFIRIYRNIAKEIEEWYWRNIITNTQFSVHDGLQLEADLRLGLWKVTKRWVNKPENYTKRLKEAIKLLTLPFGTAATDDGLTVHDPTVCCEALMTFLNDPSQSFKLTAALEQLGIDVLTHSQIRDVLRRRNDMLYSWN
ncbi:TIP-1 family-domain-containing protein [Radiomyces spectabilis]|uniref:TIP-1 family-domain-containing protein n=1 Tax=Radiomyces spectabilis TaxID=64574 RepID=UPI002220574A|nr:TIP-1 family-domain-containing protein [Radiomyces spectabilis]KAI8366626.1 TIP-1 family-domain-containing protein [Radiomyces spectabilis]